MKSTIYLLQKWLYLSPLSNDRDWRVTSNRRRSNGSGLGLAIVKAIVEAYHGSVNLQSNLGTGSTFTLVLPINCSEPLIHHVSNPRRRR